MKLEEDGKYYYEVEPKKELEREDYKPIFDMMFRRPEPIIHTEIISGKKYYFEFIERYIYVYTDDMDKKDKIKISHFPGQIKFKTKNKTEIRYIFTFEQYYKTLDYFGIKFPWSKNILLSEDNTKNLIYFNGLMDQPVTIEDMTVFDLYTSTDEQIHSLIKYFQKIKTYRDLSLFVKYYLKENIKINDYEEKDFININNFMIKLDANFEIYNIIERIYFFEFFALNKKEFFFTGPSSTGKTISLLLLSHFNDKIRRNAYFNLKALKNNDKYFEIAAYESRHLFDENQDWENAFRRILNEDCRNIYSVICELIKICGEKDKESHKKYFFILDDITLNKIGEDNFLFDSLNEIRNLISKTNNCHLIGCCSLNSEGVKDIFFNQRFSNYTKYSLNLYYKTSFINNYYKTKEEIKGNKYLKMLGYLPKYINFKDSLNMKTLNLIKKKIKKDFEKFYESDINSRYFISNLEYIDDNKSFHHRDEFKNFLETIPTQYFIIDNNNLKIDYLLPLVKQVIKELLNTNKIAISFSERDFNKELNFKRQVIDNIKTTNIFGKYYIDNYFEIPTIFRKYKIDDEFFPDSENILFYFSYMNETRYNCAIYLRNSQTLILVKIALRITKKQLEKYNNINFKKDIDEMQKFLKENNLEIKNYYFLLIVEKKFFYKTESYNQLRLLNLPYAIFNYGQNCFEENISEFYEINYSVNEKANFLGEEGEIFEFEKKDDNFHFNKEKKEFIYYAYKGMKLKDFLEQIIFEDIKDRLDELLNYDQEKYKLDKVCTLNGKEYRENEIENLDDTNILFLNLSDGILYIGSGKLDKDGKCELSFQYFRCFGSLSEINSSPSINNNMTGFIFKATNIINF